MQCFFHESASRYNLPVILYIPLGIGGTAK
jgi:hypothetical protein